MTAVTAVAAMTVAATAMSASAFSLRLVMALLGHRSARQAQGGEADTDTGESAQDVAAGWEAGQGSGECVEMLGIHGSLLRIAAAGGKKASAVSDGARPASHRCSIPLSRCRAGCTHRCSLPPGPRFVTWQWVPNGHSSVLVHGVEHRMFRQSDAFRRAQRSGEAVAPGQSEMPVQTMPQLPLLRHSWPLGQEQATGWPQVRMEVTVSQRQGADQSRSFGTGRFPRFGRATGPTAAELSGGATATRAAATIITTHLAAAPRGAGRGRG